MYVCMYVYAFTVTDGVPYVNDDGGCDIVLHDNTDMDGIPRNRVVKIGMCV
jgi:hypothetical protein